MLTHYIDEIVHQTSYTISNLKGPTSLDYKVHNALRILSVFFTRPHRLRMPHLLEKQAPANRSPSPYHVIYSIPVTSLTSTIYKQSHWGT